MEKVCVGDRIQIQSYKHNGKVHRFWEEAIVLDIQKDYIVLGNKNILVTRAEGICWKTKEPAIIYYFKDRWYNIIGQMKKEGFSYYCNIATPYIIEENTLKYIDYDLDLRIFPSGDYHVLDKLEYQSSKEKMHYSEQLNKVIKNGMHDLIQLYKSKSKVFDQDINYQYYLKYEKLKEIKNNSNKKKDCA